MHNFFPLKVRLHVQNARKVKMFFKTNTRIEEMSMCMTEGEKNV